MKRFITITALILSCSTAHAGAVLLCNEYGCRSSPYFPPIVVPVSPPIVRLPPPVRHTDPPIVQRRAEQPRPSRPNVQVPPPEGVDSIPDSAEAKGLEDDIEGFCNQHPDEQFCGRLGRWLRDHPKK